MSSLTIDLETIRDPEMPDYVPRDPGGDSFPPAPFWKIVTIGCLWADERGHVRRIGCIDGDELTMLDRLVRWVERPISISQHRPDLVTFNGRRFDLPVLTARCMRHGIAFPSLFSRDVSYRYSDAGHLDIADSLVNYGAGRHASLDAWAKIVGLPGKLDVCGSKVEDLIAQGKLPDVQAYCMSDVAQTHGVRLRFDLIRGKLENESYRSAMASLIAAIDENERLSLLSSAMNRKRMMLE